MSEFEDGWVSGYVVHMDDGQASSVLGPDGEPVKYIRRHVAGFDLRHHGIRARRGTQPKQPQQEGFDL